MSIANFQLEELEKKVISNFNSSYLSGEQKYFNQTFDKVQNFISSELVDDLEMRNLSVNEAAFFIELLQIAEENPTQIELFLNSKKMEILNRSSYSQVEAENLLVISETLSKTVNEIKSINFDQFNNAKVEKSCISSALKGVAIGGVIGATGGCAAGALLTSPTGPGALAGCGIGGLLGGLFGGAVVGVGYAVICVRRSNSYYAPSPDLTDLSHLAYLLKGKIKLQIQQ